MPLVKTSCKRYDLASMQSWLYSATFAVSVGVDPRSEDYALERRDLRGIRSFSKRCASAILLNVRGRLSGLTAVHRLLIAKKSLSFTCCMHSLHNALEPQVTFFLPHFRHP